MKLTVLGSGTGWISLKRSAPSYLVSLKDFHLLIDMGPGTLRQILKAGLTLNDISAIFISHFHPDHIADLIPFFFATRYNLGYTRKDKLELFAHRDFNEFFEGLKKIFRQWVCPPEELLSLFLVEEDLYSFTLGPFKAETLKVNHNPESLALKLEFQKKILIYSSDTGFWEPLIDFSKKADLLILECANSESIISPFHLGPKEIAEIVSKANPKKLLLTHFYPHSEHPNLDIIRKDYKGDILLAEDFMVIDI